MNDKIFRKKSVDRMSSPEQLNDCIRVTNPGVWMILAAITVFLVGVCVWGVFGRLETRLTVAAESRNGECVIYVGESDISAVKKDMRVIIGGKDFSVASIPEAPVAVTDAIGEYARYAGGLKSGEWVYVVQTDGAPADGEYRAQLVIDSVAPLFFVFN